MTEYDDYLWDRSGRPDPDLQRFESLLSRFAHNETRSPQIPVTPLWLNILPIAAAAGIVLALSMLWKPAAPGPNSHWDVLAIAGAPRIGSASITTSDSLPSGKWLETDSVSHAQLMVGDFGEVEVAPNTKMRLVTANDHSQRVWLEYGRIDACIDGPPRMFVVETPSARAVDLGCEYSLTVERDGSGHLHVMSGRVSLESNGRQSVVPEGAECETRPGHDPGTPYCENASPAFRDALTQFDFSPERKGRLQAVIETSGPCDMMALWHLLHRVPPDERGRLYDRMAQMDTPPSGITRSGIRDLDSPMMDDWWATIKTHRTCMMCGEIELPPNSPPPIDPS